jgi:hypothetical protein
MNILYLKRYINLSIKKHLKNLADGLIPLTPFVIIFKLGDINSFYEKIVLSVSFILVYYLYNKLINTEAYQFIYSNINSLFNSKKQ